MKSPNTTDQLRWLVVALEYVKTKLTQQSLRLIDKGAKPDKVRLARHTARTARLAYNSAKQLYLNNPLYDLETRRGTETATQPASAQPAADTDIFTSLPLALRLALWNDPGTSNVLPALCSHYTPERTPQLRLNPKSCVIPLFPPVFLCMPTFRNRLCRPDGDEIIERLYEEEKKHVESNGCGTEYCEYAEQYEMIKQFNKAGRKLEWLLGILIWQLQDSMAWAPLKVLQVFFKSNKGPRGELGYPDSKIDIRKILSGGPGGIADLMMDGELKWMERPRLRHWISRPRYFGHCVLGLQNESQEARDFIDSFMM